MKENVLDVLMYLFETYVDTEEDPEPDQNELRLELSKAGFGDAEIDRALEWLEGLSDHKDNLIFHACVGLFLPRLTEQDHEHDPLDLLDVDVRRFERKQPINKDFSLRRRQYSDLLKVANIASTRRVETRKFEIVIYAHSVRGLRVEDQVVLMIAQAVEPLESAIDFRITKTGFRQFQSQLVLIGLWLFFGVDIGIKQIHEYIEYIFFHAWSSSHSMSVGTTQWSRAYRPPDNFSIFPSNSRIRSMEET